MTTHRAFTNPLPSDLPGLATIAGLGRLYGHTVGGCSSIAGYDVCLIAEGSETQTPGGARFSLEIDLEGHAQWTLTSIWAPGFHGATPAECDQTVFAPEVMDAMRGHADSMPDRQPMLFASYLFWAYESAFNCATDPERRAQLEMPLQEARLGLLEAAKRERRTRKAA